MASPYLTPVYDELIEYLIQKATPSEILSFQLSESAQERATELLERQSAGELAAEEELELDQMRQFDSLVSMLKARALDALNES